MIDNSKSRDELLAENVELRRRLAQFEGAVAVRDQMHSPQLELLHRTSQTLLSTLELDQVLFTVLDEVRHELDAVASSIWLVDADTGGLVCRHATGPKSDTVVGWRLTPGQGIAGKVAADGKSLLVPDAHKNTTHFSGVDRKTGLHSRSIVTVPMRAMGSAIGVIQVLDSEPNRFTQADVQLVESLAATASLSIQMARFYEQTDRLRAFNQSIVQSMKEGVLIGDMDGHITFANPEAARLLGYTAVELAGLRWKDIVASQQRGEKAPSDRAYGDTDSYENVLITRTGEHIPVIISMRGLRQDAATTTDRPTGSSQGNGGSRLTGIVIVFTDITRRVRTEQALRHSEQRYRRLAQENAELLDQARRDAKTKDLLLNEVNHRVKNNLTAIIGLLYAQQRRPEFSDNPAFAQATKDLASRIQGLATVHSMLSAIGWEPLRLTDVSRQIVTAVAAGLPADKSFQVEISSSPVLVSPDQAHNLAIILTELTTNTAKHALTNRDCAHIDVQIEVDDNIIVLRYRDDGPGQAETIDGQEKHGVGLYLVHNIARHGLGGTVNLRQTSGLEIVLTFKQEVASTDIDGG